MRVFLAAIVGIALCGASGLFIADAQSADQWTGAGVLFGGKGYVAAPLGQLHYRDVGSRSTPAPFLLLHQTPSSMAEFADVQNEIAAHQLRVIAVDTPGYGMSDSPNAEPSAADYADNLILLLDALHIE